MKRFALVFCFFFSLNALAVFAQASMSDFTMRGVATQQMTGSGLTARHPSQPLNSKVKVANPQTGTEIEVTITGRIDPAANRMIDLSSEAAQALGIRSGDTVVMTVPAPSRREPRATQPMTVEVINPYEQNGMTIEEAIAAAMAAMYKEEEEPIDPGDTGSGSGSATNATSIEFLAWLMSMALIDAREARDAREERDARIAREERDARIAREEREARIAREERDARLARELRAQAQEVPMVVYEPEPIIIIPEPDYWPVEEPIIARQPTAPIRQADPPFMQSPPVRPEDLQIIPGLPDRYTSEIYRLQVGAYSAAEAANRVAALVASVGFSVELEYASGIYRVLATGIPAIDVYPAAVRLGSLGFGQIWVRR